MCISVDLPEPEGPMMAVKVPGANDDVDAPQGVDRRVALAEALREPAAHDDRRARPARPGRRE